MLKETNQKINTTKTPVNTTYVFCITMWLHKTIC